MGNLPRTIAYQWAFAELATAQTAVTATFELESPFQWRLDLGPLTRHLFRCLGCLIIIAQTIIITIYSCHPRPSSGAYLSLTGDLG